MPPCHASFFFRRCPARRPAWLGLLLVLLLAALLPAGCSDTPSAPPAAALPAEHFFPIELGATRLELQLALSPAERQRGLMFREDLGPDQGMLFLFDEPAPQSFWMRNTPLPLDIGFFDAQGRLLEIYPLFPYDETPVLSRSEAVLIAVETNQGWFAANGVRPGARLDLDQLAAAVTAREGGHQLPAALQ